MNTNILAVVTGGFTKGLKKKNPYFVSFEVFSGVQMRIPVFWDVMPHCSVSGYVLDEHTAFLLVCQVDQEECCRRYIPSKSQNYSPSDTVSQPRWNSYTWFWLEELLPQLRNFADFLKTSSFSQTAAMLSWNSIHPSIFKPLHFTHCYMTSTKETLSKLLCKLQNHF